jgi:TniQ
MIGVGIRPTQPLPQPIPPFLGETTKSYLYRLARANQLHPDDLRAYLTGIRAAHHHGQIPLHALAIATGRTTHALIRALPELRFRNTTSPTVSPFDGHIRRTICWRCAARRSAFPFATIWQRPEINICPAHRIWIGSHGRVHRADQYDVSELPDVLNAQRRHHRLAHRHDRRILAEAFAEAAHITALWARHAFFHDRRKPLIHALAERPPITNRLESGDPITPVVTYPETVDLARVLALPDWREPGPRTVGDLRRFQREVNHHLSIEYYPSNSPYDPLTHWFTKRQTTTI